MKKATSYPKWRGFEKGPDGCLLEQIIDLNPAMGFAYERSCEFYKDFHTHDRLMLVCPRGSSSMEVRTKNPKEKYLVDASRILLVPKDLEHDDEGVSCIYDTMALYPTFEFIYQAAKKLNLSKSDLSILSDNCITIKRNRKLDLLTQEFFYEKVIARADQEMLDYLGARIIIEVLKIIYPEKSKTHQDLEQPSSDSIIQKAIQFIESNLFASIELEDIARYSGASVSTLLRKFKTETMQTPYAFIKSRRLEEALHLLKTGNRSVGEVALLVGYENLGAFTDAFKSKYKKLPSAILRET